MFSVIYSGYEFLSQFLPFLGMLFWLKRTKKYETAYYIFTVLFALYVLCVFHVTGAGTIYELLDWRFRGLAERVNLIPFSREIDPVGYGLNVVMCMPFGFLVPLIWKALAKTGPMLLVGLSFSLLIELSQMLNIRGTDVDDLIMNTIGAYLGFLLYKAWNRVTKGRFQSDAAPGELGAYVLAIYLGRCFLYNALGLIRLWYGY